MFVLSFLKGIYFLRIYENFGHLIQMLANCFRDISVFLVFFITWILVYTMLLDMMEANFDDGDYPDLNIITITLLQMYRNSIGDISAPLYARWSEMLKRTSPFEQNQASIMISLVWTVWVLHQFLVLIILLNFLIAIIS